MAIASLGVPSREAATGTETSLFLFDPESGEPLRIPDIADGYRKADENAAILLANLRCSDLAVRAAVASAAYEHIGNPRSLATRLKALAKAQEVTRSELARAEAAYAKWIAGNAETRVEAFHHVFRLGELPSTAKLKAAACGGRADKPTRPGGDC